MVPEIGDFEEIEVIEVLVSVGDTVELDQSLITLETDKASMEIPSTAAGTITSMPVSVGDKVSQGALVAEVAGGGAAAPAPAAAAPEPKKEETQAAALIAVHTQARRCASLPESLVLTSLLSQVQDAKTESSKTTYSNSLSLQCLQPAVTMAAQVVQAPAYHQYRKSTSASSEKWNG